MIQFVLFIHLFISAFEIHSHLIVIHFDINEMWNRNVLEIVSDIVFFIDDINSYIADFQFILHI